MFSLESIGKADAEEFLMRDRTTPPGASRIVFIIRRAFDLHHWIFCQTGLPIREKPHQGYPSKGIPARLFTLTRSRLPDEKPKSPQSFAVSAPRDSAGKHLFSPRYAQHAGRLSPDIRSSGGPILCKRLRYGKAQPLLTWAAPLYLGLEKMSRAIVRHAIVRSPARRGSLRACGISDDLR